MIRTWVRCLIAYVICFLLQFLLNGALGRSVGAVDLTVALTLTAVLLFEDKVFWLIWGLLFLLAEDCLVGLVPGISVIPMAAVCGLLLLLQHHLDLEDHPFLKVIVSAAGVFLFESAYWVLAHLAGNPYPYKGIFQGLPVEIVCTAVICFVTAVIVTKQQRRRKKKNWYIS